LEDEVRRHPVGRSIAAICLDLGVSPKLCTGWFWNGLFYAMHDYGGPLAGMLMTLHRREWRFEKEDWKHPRSLGRPEQTHEGVRRVLGFCLGEEPVDPFRLVPWPGPAVPCPEVGAAPGAASPAATPAPAAPCPIAAPCPDTTPSPAALPSSSAVSGAGPP
jgi:hypothetical protein